MPLSAGARLGPYEILSPIDAGGMGEVYRARDSRLDRDVAVKVLPQELLSDAEALARFEREAKAVAALSHPNILAIHDFGREGGVAYAVMELLEGETLRERLDAGPIPQRKALDYALQAAQGLAAAHERGVIHRDLKPQNLFVTRDGIVKILDFGLVKLRGGAGPDGATNAPTTPGTKTGMILGTVGYMSPEQVRGAPADHRSDIFSLGAVIFEMLTARRAFRADSDVETMMSILRDDPLEASVEGKSLSAELADIVGHCLEKSPDERFQTARDLAFALRVAERESRGGGPPSSGRSEGGSRPISGTVPATEGLGRSIAVLPFRNLSPDRESEYFSDGVTEEIINALSKIEALRVASRTSAFAFKGKDDDVRKIGAALGVGTVLEGSVRQAGKRIRISAQLVNVADGYHLWSERYDRQMEDVFEVQDEIARSIAEALKVRLLPAEEAGISARGTTDVDAYNHYLKGLYYFNRREPAEAIAAFEKALARDPRYTEAYTGLADALCIHGFYGGIDTRVAFARARAATEKALELEPDAAEVQLSVGIVEHYYGWDTVREEAAFRRAITLAPRWAPPYSWLGLMLGASGRAEEGIAMARRSVELEPLSANAQTNVALAYFGARRFEEADAEFRRALSMDPNSLYPLWSFAMNCLRLSKYDEAVASLDRAVELTGRRQTFYLALLGSTHAAAGNRQRAMELLDELKARSSHEYVAPFFFAFVYIGLGDLDEAMAYVEKACAERNAFFWWVREFPTWEAIRAHPRFPALLSQIAPA